MADQDLRAAPSQLLMSLAAFVVVVAGMRASADLIVPFLLAVFIAVISAPALDWLEQRRLPRAVAMLLVIVAIVGIGGAITGLVGSSLNSFTSNLPDYTNRLNGYSRSLEGWLDQRGVPFDARELRGLIDAGRVMKLAGEMFNSFGGVLTNAFLIFLTVVFILLETASFAVKLRAVSQDPDSTLAQLGNVTANVKRYLALKTLTSLATGLIIGLGLRLLEVDNPVLWGLLAFMLNYVPSIGSIIAAVPAVLLALVDLGMAGAMQTAALYLVVNILIGSVLEPRLMGREMGMSTLVVFVSLVFWGWVLGPVGMFLSVPLTMSVKIALGASASTQWVAVFLGTGKEAELEPAADTTLPDDAQ